jgi:hypothetical protein
MNELMKEKHTLYLILFLMFSFLAVEIICLHQGSTIEEQRKLIQLMEKSPGCMHE